MRERGVEPNAISFNAAISACASGGGQWEKAVQLIDEMRQNGLEPDVISFSAAISACEKGGGQWEKAIQLLAEMQRNGVAPDVISFSAAISACEKGGEWNKALELLGEMRQCGVEPNDISYNAVIESLEKMQRNEEADEAYMDAVKRGFYVDFWRDQEGKLDLHTASEAIARVVLRAWMDDLKSGDRKPANLIIVTGRGNNSVGAPVLPKGVRSFLRETHGPVARDDPNNPGILTLTKDSIEDWLSLYERLDELKEAEAQGLLTAEEAEATKKAVLASLGNVEPVV